MFKKLDRLCVGALALSLGASLLSAAAMADDAGTSIDPKQLAREVTIYRDAYGTAHIDGKTDAAVVFGFGYCQAEDNFWQIEESYAMGLGRLAELYGKQFVQKDFRNRAFEIPQRSKADWEKLEPEPRRAGEAFIGGINYFLDTHPEVKPRMIKRFEPWMMLSFARAAGLELVGSHMHVASDKVPTNYEQNKLDQEIKAQTGSNALVINGSRTRSGRPMLNINPHQPYFGFGQFYEAHLRSGEGWNFTGATFFGSPMLTLGHNDFCGWAFTVNEPGVGSSWRETFDDPTEPLNYRYDKGYRKAVEWKDTIKIRQGSKVTEAKYTFRKTHHGPILQKVGDNEYVSGNIGKLFEAVLSRQSMKMIRAKSFAEFREAMEMRELPLFNTVYADKDNNIFYLYNGTVPKRDPQFDWGKAVDGSDTRTEWQGIHSTSDLPQVFNPPSGFIQSCNSTPFTASDDANPALGDYPKYMLEDGHDDKRRAKVSRMLLRQMKDMTYDKWFESAFDTTIYWALMELPRYKAELAKLTVTDPELAEKTRPYLDHLLDWDCKGSFTSTQATLSTAWYEEMYGFGYPAETLKAPFVGNYPQQFRALIAAAEKLQNIFGNWKVAYGDVNRLQRHPDVSDFYKIPFSDKQPSLPSAGLPGPPGSVFTMYFTPTIDLGALKSVKKHYAVVGSSYMCVIEFTDRIKSKSLLPFGVNGDAKSPHFFDQAELMSKMQMKDTLFYWEDVVAAAKRVYHPGEAPAAAQAGLGAVNPATK